MQLVVIWHKLLSKHNNQYGLLLRHNEVQQGPELLQGVLQWRSCDQKPVIGLEVHHGLVEEGVIILQSVRLIHSNEGPVNVAQKRLKKHKCY